MAPSSLLSFLSGVVPAVGGFLAVLAAVVSGLFQREKARADGRVAFMAAMVDEVVSLRAAEQLGTAQMALVTADLQTARLDIVRCHLERGLLSARCSVLEEKVKVLTGGSSD